MAVDFFDPTYLEACYAALFMLLQTASFAGGISISNWARLSDIPDDSVVGNQPACFLIQGPLHAEEREQKLFGPEKWLFTAFAVIYLRANPTQVASNPLPSTLANYITWGIATALAGGAAAPNYQKQTLGGLVSHCWIEGVVGLNVSNEQVVITVPIVMLAGQVG